MKVLLFLVLTVFVCTLAGNKCQKKSSEDKCATVEGCVWYDYDVLYKKDDTEDKEGDRRILGDKEELVMLEINCDDNTATYDYVYTSDYTTRSNGVTRKATCYDDYAVVQQENTGTSWTLALDVCEAGEFGQTKSMCVTECEAIQYGAEFYWDGTTQLSCTELPECDYCGWESKTCGLGDQESGFNSYLPLCGDCDEDGDCFCSCILPACAANDIVQSKECTTEKAKAKKDEACDEDKENYTKKKCNKAKKKNKEAKKAVEQEGLCKKLQCGKKGYDECAKTEACDWGLKEENATERRLLGKKKNNKPSFCKKKSKKYDKERCEDYDEKCDEDASDYNEEKCIAVQQGQCMKMKSEGTEE